MSNFISTNFDFTNKNMVSVIDDLPYWSAPFGTKLINTVKLKKNSKVLDIGSGLGFPLIELSQRFDINSEIIGIDPWKTAIERTQLKINKYHLRNVKIIEGVAEELPFDNEYFDIITSNNGTNNVDDQEQTFKEISRVAKKDAQLVITLNLEDSMIEFYNVLENYLVNNNRLEEIERLKNHIYEKRKPLNFTKNLVEKNGFAIKSIFKDEFYYKYVDGTSMFNNHTIRLAFLESWKNIVNEEDQHIVFTELEKEINIIAQKQGFFKLSIPWVCIEAFKV